MKITAVTALPVSEWRPMLFALVETEDGRLGIGEAGLTSREWAVAGAIEHLSAVLVGEDATRVEHLWQLMWRGGFHPGGAVLASAISAIDIALHDLKAQRYGVPVYEMIGGKVRDRVAGYCHIGGATPDKLAAAARAAVKKGWRFLRWGLPDGADGLFEPRAAIDRHIVEWRLLREELGDEIELCTDLHARLDAADAIRVCRAVERYRPFFIEDPVRSEHIEAYRRVRAHTSVPLAAGEQLDTKWRYRALIEEELVDYARIDIAIAGGFTEARKIAALCETHMIGIVTHNAIGPVTTTAALHLHLATTNAPVMEVARQPAESLAEALSGQPEFEDGCLVASEAPGLGLTVDRAALARKGYVPHEMPRLDREDGSFTNW
jgi:L-alanine-DL-glutamate epimerase-like enolase superfamily enzyme